ncbi:MAG: D-alanyl-D-alanine carboxypeptidase [Clostridia bacterium]|nr:D-alanyl-D-alanine carboxypeptidase [Clostridia bacterium]
MKNKLKKTFAFLVSLAFFLNFTLSFAVYAARNDIEAVKSGVNLELSANSACLMDFSTGEILYEQNADARAEPASVTKIMSLLLVFEALENDIIRLDDTVTASDYASSMGGSQIWLEPGEQMTVNDMIKEVAVVSANDCTVALAEHLAGSEEAFTARMNKRALELGMENTVFSNCTGLPTENHYTTAKDIAVMTRELLKHELIFDYTKIWMDSLRNGEMGLSNTNKLIRFYPGANGMKTGYTDSAKYCLSATARRGDLQLIATVMTAPTSNDRFNDAKKMLDFGFANFSVYNTTQVMLPEIRVKGGVKTHTTPVHALGSILIAKGRDKLVEAHPELPGFIEAPAKKGDVIGKIVYKIGDDVISETDVILDEDVRRVTFSDILKSIVSGTLLLN